MPYRSWNTEGFVAIALALASDRFEVPFHPVLGIRVILPLSVNLDDHRLGITVYFSGVTKKPAELSPGGLATKKVPYLTMKAMCIPSR